MKRSLCIFVLVLSLLSCEQKNNWFLEEQLQEVTKAPIRFEPDLISTEGIEYNTSVSNAFPELYFSMAAPDFSYRNIMMSRFENRRFTQPEKVQVGGEIYDASDVHISANGDFLYFKMRGQIDGQPERRDGNIFRSPRIGDQWGPAEILPETVNSSTLSEYYPISTLSGNLYFSRENPDTDYDIYVSHFENGQYQKAIKLPATINTDLLESDAFIAPDESFMIFVRMYEEGAMGVSDLYISFNQGNDQWTEARNMRAYNSLGVDGSPCLSPDGNFLFFTSTRDSPNPEAFDGHLDLYVARFDINDWK